MPYYTHHGERVRLKSADYVAVRHPPLARPPRLPASLLATAGFGNRRKAIPLPHDGLLLVPTEPGADLRRLHRAVSKTAGFLPGPPVLMAPNGALLIPNGSVTAALPGSRARRIPALLRKVRATMDREPNRQLPFHVLTPDDGDVFRLANTLAEDEHIDAQPRFARLLRLPRAASGRRQRTLLATSFVTTPPPSQWWLKAIQAEDAWKLTRGSEQVSVAVIDDGVDLDHPEFEGRILASYDLVDGDAQAQPQNEPPNTHGTACAGIIGARGRYVTGVAPGCRLIPIRVGITTERGFLYGPTPPHGPQFLARAIEKAVELKAWVLNLSISDPGDLEISRAITYALSKGRGGKGCVVVAAAGNDGGPVRYPAAHPGVIAVAATNIDDERLENANHASCRGRQISVAAPGDEIRTTDIHGAEGKSHAPPPEDDYCTLSGTSAAAPFVAGVVALMLSANPQLTAGEVREVLELTADKTGTAPYVGGQNDDLGHGRVNAFMAIREAVRRAAIT